MECRHKFTMCRLCLCESECFIDIFQVNERFGHVTAEVIRDLLQLQVSETDGYPHVVCSICLGKLADFRQFKERCQDSKDTYSDVFASDEGHTEHPIDIEEPRTVKLEPEDPLDTQETLQEEEQRPMKLEPKDPLDTQGAQEEMRKRASPEYLECIRERTCRKPYGPYENTKKGVNQRVILLLKKIEKVTVDANPRENVKSSGCAKVEVGKMDVKVIKNCESPSEKTYKLPVEKSDANGVGSSVEELKDIRTRGENGNYVDVNVDGIDTRRRSKRGRGEEAPVGVEEREGKRECFSCHDCGKNFGKKDVLIRHLELHGYEVNNEGCGEERHIRVRTDVNCGSKLNKSDLRAHRLTHAGEKPYACKICRKGFAQNGHLLKHGRTHYGEKPFVCETCGKKFADNYNLKIHGRTHSGEKPFGCEICGKKFAKSGVLSSHRRIHTGEKLHECLVCGKRFAQSGHLKGHARIHSGEKPFACEFCKKCFSNGSNLGRHLRTHSQEKPC